MAIVGEAHIIVRAITTNVERDIQRSLRGVTGQGNTLGRQFGQAFGSGFSKSNMRSFSQFRSQALAANEAFRKLVTTGYFVGPAIAFVAAGISSLVSGLFALGSQIAVATPSLIVLPSIFSAIGQAALTAKLAFSGISKALKGTKAPKEVDRLPSLFEALAAAEDRLIRANTRLTQTQTDLNKAYEEAAERIQQTRFDAEDAAISEKKAAIELEKARATLARVQDLPPNSRARREAELAFQEADLNYRRAVDKNADLAKEVDKISAKGTRTAQEELEYSEEVNRAKADIADAQTDQQKALVELAKAQKAVNEEQKRQASGAGKAASETSTLSEEALNFVEYLKTLKPALEDLKSAAGEKLFPKLEIAIQNLADKLLPRLLPILRDTGDAIGDAAISFSEIITSTEVMKNLEAVAKTNQDTIRKLGTVVGNLFGGFVALLSAADPLIRRFTDWAVALSASWKESMETKNQTGQLTKTFETAGDVAAQLGRSLGNIWDALKNIGRAASGPGSGGEMLLDAFEGATKKFSEFTAKLEASGDLSRYFKGVASNVIEIGKVFVEFVKEFLKLGDDKGVADTAKTLAGVAGTIGSALSRLLEGAPALGEFASKFAEFIGMFAESESINNFFKALNFVLDGLIAIFGNETVMKITLFVSAQLAFVKAFQLMSKVAIFGGETIAGYFYKIDDGIKLIKGAPGIFQNLYNNVLPNMVSKVGVLETAILKLSSALGVGVGASTLIVVAAIAAVIAIFVAMYMKSETLRNAIKDLIENVLYALKDAWDRINQAIRDAIPQIDGVGGVFKTLGDFFGTYIVPLLQVVLVGAIQMVVDRIVGMIKIVGGVIDIWRAVWEFVKGIFALLTGDTDKAKESFLKAFGALKDGLGKIFGGVADIILAPFKFAFNLIAKLWNNTLGKLSFTIPSWIPVIGGKAFTMPKIPEWDGGFGDGPDTSVTDARGLRRMAAGGTVFPRPGGTLAQIAEAGRPERVEPLDPDGLSKRDKKMIEFLSGGMNGAVFNIYPSPGMDEVELASLVNRQISFQLRRGAA